ncbi:hemicentin-1-like [Haliotis rufescens]|uniref:hemicentin-1-like n=1 Tax=Haliotis rufescens TaxID=6454 RepID=UPI00201F688B|nr:hemicentin-1-like [Haliotis rufescens]
MNIALVSVLLLVAVAASHVSAADRCSYLQYYLEVYKTRCGWRGWGRCWRYRYKTEIRYKDCTHGQWSPWSAISETQCSETCGGGEKEITMDRTCTAPAPSNGGHKCAGGCRKVDVVACNEQPCPIDGGWSEWGAWKGGDCSALCGGGTINQHRKRSCNKPVPQFGGADCSGVDKENGTNTCNTDACGDRCPAGEIKYHPHATDGTRFYQCAHGVAVRRSCGPGTIYDASINVCSFTATQAPVPPVNSCDPSLGMFQRHPRDCSRFLICVEGGRVYEQNCPSDMKWNNDIQTCDYAHNVDC